jgi:hypothetical protein
MDAAIAERYAHASDDTRRMIDRLLAQDADDRAWAGQIGPACRQTDVAQLLGKSKQAVSADTGLLRLEMRDGAIGYPVFQFDGRRPQPGVSEVVSVLARVVATSWTIASWLTSPHAELDGDRPIDALRAGRVQNVVSLARRTARSLAG